jgi:methylmalonyl-CoA/ethylmalonyl-CoA epimerase
MTQAPGMVLDHIGIAVRSLEDAVPFWERVFGYRPATEAVTNSRQQVRVVFLQKPGSADIKLIAPAGETSPLWATVKQGGGLHHLCMRCADLDSELARLHALGIRTLSDPAPGEAFANERIAFVYAGHGLNVELIDTTIRSQRLA